MATLADLMERHEIVGSHKERGISPMTQGTQYTVTFRCKTTGERAAFTFHDSIANRQKGTRFEYVDVLDCLLSDASTAENCPTIEDVQSELGYENRSDARRVFIGCQDIRKKLMVLLGDDLYQIAMYEVERL